MCAPNTVAITQKFYGASNPGSAPLHPLPFPLLYTIQHEPTCVASGSGSAGMGSSSSSSPYGESEVAMRLPSTSTNMI